MHSSRMRTTRLLTVSRSARGSLPNPLDADPVPWMQSPLVDRMTDTCENITLPQTSFAGGKKRRC